MVYRNFSASFRHSKSTTKGKRLPVFGWIAILCTVADLAIATWAIAHELGPYSDPGFELWVVGVLIALMLLDALLVLFGCKMVDMAHQHSD